MHRATEHLPWSFAFQNAATRCAMLLAFASLLAICLCVCAGRHDCVAKPSHPQPKWSSRALSLCIRLGPNARTISASRSVDTWRCSRTSLSAKRQDILPCRRQLAVRLHLHARRMYGLHPDVLLTCSNFLRKARACQAIMTLNEMPGQGECRCT